MKPIEGYKKLSNTEQKLFVVAHLKHVALFQGNECDQYSMGNVLSVSSNPQENAVDVRFANDQKWQYTAKGARSYTGN